MLEEGPDGTPRLPKVPLSDDWLVYKNYVDFQVEPSKATFRNSLCTPYMYTKYACIFGLTGSVTPALTLAPTLTLTLAPTLTLALALTRWASRPRSCTSSCCLSSTSGPCAPTFRPRMDRAAAG